MLNYLWAGMILAGILFGAFNGKMADITNAALDSAKDAVTLCITMIGVMAFWTGIMEIASKAGVIGMASKKLGPVIRFLFPELPKEHKANEHIATNFIANFLGLGWAATPAGLMAMSELKKIHNVTNTASRAMCMLIAVNVSSVQLLPINIIIMRQKYLSAAPFDIVFPSIVATSISTFAAVAAVKVCERRYFK